MKAHALDSLITEYLAQVKKATDLLEHAFGTRNILRLWRSKKIPQRGPVTDDVTYELHGLVAVYIYLIYVLTLIMVLMRGLTVSILGGCTCMPVSCRVNTKNTLTKSLSIMTSTSI